MKFMAMLKDKRFRYGTMSTAMMIFAVVIFVLVNVLADEFNRSWDLTTEQFYTLTPQTHRFLDELETDVTLYYVVRTGTEAVLHSRLVVSQLLAEFESASPRITVETRDPLINPTFVHQFVTGADGGIPDGSVIVRTEEGFRVITPSDMETVGFSMQTFRQFLESIDVEREITQAIHALTLGDPPAIYHITGSGEDALPPSFVEFLEAENFAVREHDALMNDIPETADALFITMPSRDWGSVKADRILDYLDNREGRVFMALWFTAERFPEMERVLAAYGLQLGDYLVIEGDTRLAGTIPLPNGGAVLGKIPLHGPHEGITDPLVEHGFIQLFVRSTGLEVLQMRRASTVIEPLLMTSRDSIGLRLETDDTVHQTPEDVEGPFALAVAVTDSIFVDTPRTAKLVVVSNEAILHDYFNNFIGGGNWAFISNSLNWLQGQPPGIWIPPRRPPGGAPAMMTDAQVFTMSGIAMGALPLAIFGMGIFIWLRRRHN